MRNNLLTTTARLRQPAPPPPLWRKDDPAVAALVTDALLKARDAAVLCQLSLPAFWKNVKSGRLPAPVYPAPRAPRWWRSRLCAAIDATAALPVEAKEQRRQARLARERAETATRELSTTEA